MRRPSLFFLCYFSALRLVSVSLSASDAFPAFWRESATDATETKKKRISSAIVERRRGFRVSLIFCASPEYSAFALSPFVYRCFRRLTPPPAPFSSFWCQP
jgi:hypothetical protein